MRIQSIPLSWARRHCANAVAEGVSLCALFDKALISPRFDDDRDRISSAQLALLYYHANQATEDEGRRNSRAQIPIGFGTLAARALFGCSTLETGLGAIARLSQLTASALQVAVRVDHDDARLLVYCEEGRAGADTVSLEDAYLSFLFMCVGHFLGRPMPIASFETRAPTHMNIGQAHWATGAMTSLASSSALVFPRALLAARRTADPRDELFADIFLPWMQFVERGSTLHPMVEQPIAGVRVADLAAAQNVSSATARRRLDTLDGGFRQCRAEALVSAGVARLQEGNVSVDAIALELGYSDARSFRRFLKSASGKTPEEWRREGSSPAPQLTAAIRARVLEFAQELDGQLKPVPLFGDA